VKIKTTFNRGFEIIEYIIKASRKLLSIISYTKPCLQYYDD